MCTCCRFFCTVLQYPQCKAIICCVCVYVCPCVCVCGRIDRVQLPSQVREGVHQPQQPQEGGRPHLQGSRGAAFQDGGLAHRHHRSVPPSVFSSCLLFCFIFVASGRRAIEGKQNVVLAKMCLTCREEDGKSVCVCVCLERESRSKGHS